MDQITPDIGSRLRVAREERGLTLRDVANVTKISTTALHAIEHNEFARLPGGVFRRAYVRAFAAEVGLNGDELAREYRAQFEIEVPVGPLVLHTASPDRPPRFLRWLAVAASAGIVLMGILTLLTLQGRPPLADAQWAGAAADPVEGLAVSDEEANDRDGVALASTTVVETNARPLRLEIRADGPCWVSAAADGERVIYRLMRTGDRAVVEAWRAITFRVGDAGVVAYRINGVPGRQLGGTGEAVTVRITDETLGTLQVEATGARHDVM
jgi:cytoskeleton protein RodZ